MIVYCVCIEELDDQGQIYRVEIFSTFKQAKMYLDTIVEDEDDIKGDIIEYTIDDPESGDTTYAVDDDSTSTSQDDDY